MRNPLLLFFSLVLLVIENLPAQNPGIQHYTTVDGLPCNMVNYIYQDSKKFIWFATDAGVAKFDGSQFITYTKKDGLNSNTITKFKEDSFGRLWITNRNGSLNFFFKDKIFNAANAPFLDSLNPVEPFHDFFQDDDQTIYFYNLIWEIFVLDRNNTIKKIARIDDILLKIFPRNDVANLFTIQNNPAGEYLVWTWNAILKFKKLFENPILFYSRPEHFRRASASRDGYFYIVASDSCIYKYKDEFLVDSIPMPINIGHGEGRNNYFLLDNDGFFWIRNWNEGVYCFKNNHVVRHFDIKHVTMIVQDNENNIWISSNKEGVFKISTSLTSYYHYENINFQNRGIRNMDINPGGGIWLTNGQSVYLLRNNKFYVLDFEKGNVSFDVIYNLKKDNLIVGEKTSHFFIIRGIKTDPATKKIFYDKIISSAQTVGGIPGISIDRKGDRLTAFFYFSFFCVDPDRLFNIFDLPEHNVGSRIYNTFYDNNNNLVINAAKNYVFDGDSCLPARGLSCFDNKMITQHLILSDSTEIFVIENENIYLSCNNSIYNLSSSFGKSEISDIRYVTYDKPVLYLATFRNIYKCENPFNVIKGKPVHLQFVDVTFRNIYHILASNDSLYVASEDGLTIIPEAFIDRIVSYSPIPYIQSILVNEKVMDLSGQNIIFTGNNKIKIIFGSINYSSSPVIYSYKLEGSDKDWSAGLERMIVYQNLPKGDYKFKLRISKPYSGWSKEVECRIRIKAVFWQHPLFLTGLVLIFAISIVLVIIRRKNLLIMRREMDHQLVTLEQKALQSMMNPHFIFNSLGSIQNYLLQKKTGEAGLYLSQFARLIRQNLNAINATMITIDEETDRLKNYLDLEKMRLTGKFEYRFDIDKSIEPDETFIPSMLVQPLVENAIWHGITPLETKGMVSVHFQMESETSLKIIVEDNGIGMTKSATYSNKNKDHLRLTLELNRKRLELLGKKFNVSTGIEFAEALPGNPNPGTRVVMVVPFTFSDRHTNLPFTPL